MFNILEWTLDDFGRLRDMSVFEYDILNGRTRLCEGFSLWMD